MQSMDLKNTETTDDRVWHEINLNLTKTNIRTSVSWDVQMDAKLFDILLCKIELTSLVLSMCKGFRVKVVFIQTFNRRLSFCFHMQSTFKKHTVTYFRITSLL